MPEASGGAARPVLGSTTDRAVAHAWIANSLAGRRHNGYRLGSELLLAAGRNPGQEQVRVPFVHRVTAHYGLRHPGLGTATWTYVVEYPRNPLLASIEAANA